MNISTNNETKLVETIIYYYAIDLLTHGFSLCSGQIQ